MEKYMVFPIAIASSSSLATGSLVDDSNGSNLQPSSLIDQIKLATEAIESLISDAREFVQLEPIDQESMCLESMGFSIEQIDEIQTTLLYLAEKEFNFSRCPEVNDL